MATWSELPSIRDASGKGASYVPEFWEAEIIPEAFEKLRFKDVADMVPKIGLGGGESFHINLGGTMSDAGTLAQGTKVPIDSTIGFRQVNGTMREWGRAIEVQKRMLTLAPQDPQLKWLRGELERNLNRAVDGGIRDAMYAATTIRVNGGTYLKTGGTFSIIGTYANAKTSGAGLLKVAEQLAANDVPTFPDETWMVVMHPLQISDLRADTTASSGFVPVMQYTENGIQRLFKYEVGMFMHGLRVVSSTRIQGTLEQASTGTVQQARAVACGPDSVAWVVGMVPEIVFDEDYQKDFKRTQVLGWLGDMEFILKKDPYVALYQTTVVQNITANGVA